jgi:hypothetical protein
MEEDEEENFRIGKAVEYLEEGYVLMTIVKGRPNYFMKKRDEVLVQSDNLLAPLRFNEFADLYKDAFFSLVPDDEPVCDPLKDAEYYTWANRTTGL